MAASSAQLLPWPEHSSLFLGYNSVKFLFYTFNVNITVENENESLQRLKGCVFTLLNQTSLLDGPIGVLVYPLPCMWLANIEYALIPFFGWCMWVFGWVIIRQMPKQAKRTLNKAVAFLENGGNLWVSIEGRRSKHGFLSPYKKGPVVLAIKAQADIVPIAIYGAKNCISYCNYTKKSKEVIINTDFRTKKNHVSIFIFERLG